jgi:luciferase family oxidoreductase group 1
VLEAIAPGRIDLGLGRAPGSDGLTAYALNPNAATAADRFPSDVRDLLAWVSGGPLAEKHPFRDIIAQPAGPTVPEAWILGSSDYGAQVAAHFGLPYCFAHFITDGQGVEEALETYRLGYKPSLRHPEPLAAICVWAVAAETAAEAERLFSSRALARLWRDRGIYAPLPSPEEAAAEQHSPDELARLERHRERGLFGTPDVLGAKLRDLAARLGVEDVAVLSAAHNPVARRRSYELLAAEFSLTAERVSLAAE